MFYDKGNGTRLAAPWWLRTVNMTISSQDCNLWTWLLLTASIHLYYKTCTLLTLAPGLPACLYSSACHAKTFYNQDHARNKCIYHVQCLLLTYCMHTHTHIHTHRTAIALCTFASHYLNPHCNTVRGFLVNMFTVLCGQWSWSSLFSPSSISTALNFNSGQLNINNWYQWGLLYCFWQRYNIWPLELHNYCTGPAPKNAYTHTHTRTQCRDTKAILQRNGVLLC